MKFLGMQFGVSNAAPKTQTVISDTPSPPQDSAYMGARPRIGSRRQEQPAEEEKVTVIERPVRHVARFVPVKFTQELAARFPDKTLLTSEEEREWSDIIQTYDRTEANFMAIAGTSAKVMLAEQQERFRQAAVGGDLSQLQAGDGWTKEDFEQDRLQRLRAVKGERKRIAAGAIPIAIKVAECLAEMARLHAEQLEEIECKTAAVWGLDFTPSLVLTLLRYVAAHHVELAQPDVIRNPKEVLDFVGITPKL